MSEHARDGGSLEERAAWDAFVREVFGRVSAAQPAENQTHLLACVHGLADQMIEKRRAKFPPQPRRPEPHTARDPRDREP